MMLNMPQRARGVPVPPLSWLSGAASGSWINLPNSTLSSSGAGWTGTAPGGTSNYQAIVNAWGGGVLNTVGVKYGGSFVAGTFLVIFGGGHGDYGGNEVMAYGPFEADSPTWHRLTDPTIPAPVNVQRDGSGNPVSRHTYDSLVFLPVQNKMLCIGAAGYHSVGSAFNDADVFDFATNTWSTADTGFPAYGGGGAGTISIVSGYDAATGKAWGCGYGNGQKLGAYDAAAGTWASYNKDNPSGPTSGKGSVGRGLLVFANGSTVYAQSLASPTSVLYTPTCTGTAPASGAIATLDWDSVDQCFIAVGSSGQIHRLTPGTNPAAGGDNWVWTTQTVTGTTPGTSSSNGVYGRLRAFAGAGVVPHGVIFMPSATSPICFFKA